jgi:hypothetical protein
LNAIEGCGITPVGMAARIKLERQGCGGNIRFLDQREELPLNRLFQESEPRKVLDVPLDVRPVMDSGDASEFVG